MFGSNIFRMKNTSRARNNASARDMTVGEPWKLILQFALPLIMANTLQQVYATVDTVVLGRYSGINSLAVLGTSSWINWMIVSVITSYAQAVSMVMAKHFGAGDQTRVRQTLGTSCAIGVILAAGMFAMLVPSARHILLLLSTPEEVLDAAMQYLGIMLFGVFTLMGYNLSAAYLRAIGDSQTPFFAIVAATVVNIVLDVWFVAVWKWGVTGVAVATVAAEAMSAVVCIAKVFGTALFRISRRELRVRREILESIGELTIPMILQSFVIAIGGFAVQNKINSFGTVFAGGMSATNNVFGLLETSAIALSQAASIFVSQNRGAGAFKRIKKGVLTSVVISVLIAALCFGSMLHFGKDLLALYVSPPEALEYAWRLLLAMSAGLFIMYPMYVLRQSMQALGNAVIPMIGGVIQLFVRVAVAQYITEIFGRDALYYSNTAAWFTSLLLMVCFLPRQYRRVKTS